MRDGAAQPYPAPLHDLDLPVRRTWPTKAWGMSEDGRPATATVTSGQDQAEVRAARACLYRLVGQYGSVEARRLLQLGLGPDDLARQVAGRRGEDSSPAADLAVAARLGVRLVTPEDDDWPAAPLQAMEAAVARGSSDLAPPLALWVKGSRRPDELMT